MTTNHEERRKRAMNNYERPEVIELGEAHNEILSQKQLDVITDNLGVPMRTNAPTLDDFDE
jgi:hypothetical protein